MLLEVYNDETGLAVVKLTDVVADVMSIYSVETGSKSMSKCWGIEGSEGECGDVTEDKGDETSLFIFNVFPGESRLLSMSFVATVHGA